MITGRNGKVFMIIDRGQAPSLTPEKAFILATSI